MLSSVFPRPISEGTPVVVVQGKLFEEIPDNSSDLKERAHGAWSGRPNPRDEKKCCSCSSRRIFYTTLIVIAGLIVLAGLWPLVSYLTISVRPCIHPDASLPFRAPPTMVSHPTEAYATPTPPATSPRPRDLALRPAIPTCWPRCVQRDLIRAIPISLSLACSIL